MNILSFEDVENYLKFKQVYFRKEICNIDLKTTLKGAYVHNLQSITCNPVRENVFYLAIEVDGITIPIYKDCTMLEFFAWVKTNFTPISKLIDKYNER
jgi:hypothetical protein